MCPSSPGVTCWARAGTGPRPPGLTVPAPTRELNLVRGLPSCSLVSAGSPVQPSGGPPATRTPGAEGSSPCSPRSDRGLRTLLSPTRRQADHRHRLFPPGSGPPASWPGQATSPGQGGTSWSSPPGHTGCSGWGAGSGTGPRALPPAPKPGLRTLGRTCTTLQCLFIIIICLSLAVLGLCSLWAFSSVVGGGYP